MSTTIQTISTAQLFLDERYQRQIDWWPKAISAEWDEALCQVIEVSDRGDGTYAIIDGGNRWTAAKLSNIQKLVCRVHKGLTWRKEAQLHSKLNSFRRPQTQLQKHKTALGWREKTAVQVDKACKEAGVSMPSCIKTLRDIVEADGREQLTAILSLVNEVWGIQKPAYRAGFLHGVNDFLKVSGEVTHDKKCRLASKFPATLFNEAKELAAKDGKSVGNDARNAGYLTTRLKAA